MTLIAIVAILALAKFTPTRIWQQYLYYNYDLYDFSTITTNDLNASANGSTVYFRAMSYATTQCTGYSDYYAVLINSSDPTKCQPLTQGTLDPDNFSGNSNDSTVISISYPTNGPAFTINSVCGNSTKEPILVISSNAYTIQLETPSLCAIEVNTKSFWSLYSNYKIIFALVFWGLGLVLIIFGLKLFGIILGVIGFLSAELSLNILFNQYILPYNVSSYVVWIVLGVCSIISLLIGLLCIKFKKYGLFLLGILFGLIAGMVLFSSVLYLLCNGSHWGLLATEILFGVGCGFLTFYLDLKAIIFTTSFIGSYLAIRATSWYLGGYPNEWTLYEQLQNKTFQGYWKFYIYLIALAILSVVGVIVQWVLYQKSPDEAKETNGLLQNLAEMKNNAATFLNPANSRYKEIKSGNTEALYEKENV